MTTERAILHKDRTRRASTASKHHPHTFAPVPVPSPERLAASLNDHAFDLENARPLASNLRTASEKDSGKTVLYLAYGSNLCRETFRGVRGIRPISQVNVVVPELRLTFDLPGLPYSEPCFANTALRDAEGSTSDCTFGCRCASTSTSTSTSHTREEEPSKAGEGEAVNQQREGDREGQSDYHKDRWTKGLIGCVYEVTLSDYAHIIATEGGGASYQDILVFCYPLPSNCATVPDVPTGAPFKAHTLFAPASSPSKNNTANYSRPDPSYAQPSARYLKLITDGAAELALPNEYREYLDGIRPYRVTTRRQVVGRVTFMALWMPFVLMIFGLNRKLSDDKGRSPKWVAALSGAIFKSMWVCYDGVWKHVFGDGERTVGEGEDGYAAMGYAEGGSCFLREEDEEDLGDRAWGSLRRKESVVERERLLV